MADHFLGGADAGVVGDERAHVESTVGRSARSS